MLRDVRVTPSGARVTPSGARVMLRARPCHSERSEESIEVIYSDRFLAALGMTGVPLGVTDVLRERVCYDCASRSA